MRQEMTDGTTASRVVSERMFSSGTQAPIYWKIHSPLGGREYQSMSFGGKNMKRQREKGGKVKEKGRKGKENEKRGRKRVK
jgi:hypothetical protein